MVVNIGSHELFKTEAWELIGLLEVIVDVLIVRIDKIFKEHIILEYP